MVQNERRLERFSDRVETMEARMKGVAVAVRHIIGTEGQAVRKWESWA